MTALDRCYNIADLRSAAEKRLPKGVFDYIDKGTEDMTSLGNNRSAFAHIKLLNKVVTDISDVQLESDVLGKPAALPMAIAPTGTAGIAWYEGEFELAKAAAAAGVPFTLATGSNTPMEKLSNEAGGRLWMQLYMWKEKDLSDELVKRAARNGFEALLWTVDIGHGSNREHNLRNGFSTPYVLNTRSVIDMLRHPTWLAFVMGRYFMNGGMPKHVNYPPGYQMPITGNVAKLRNTGANPITRRADLVSWDDVDRLRDIFPGKLLIKGVMRPDDAAKAIEHGVDGIVVSNHGGRNMDSAPATIDVLPGIVEAVGGKMSVIVDSGVRRGSDIVKCLALGADAVLAGRATLYGTAAGGEAGASKAISILKDEMKRTMAYVGTQRTADITDDVLWRG
ncbi:MAG: alpha-hydroxy-acid oxidizing protein [Rhodospirillaceae bacterium]|jgi:(S)-mandelate dehydrogenase|nr:alpha-hydroxy-acid oxidizing protein [Rhodospirillaceae bacterium]